MLINHSDMEDWEWSLLIMIIINSFINIYFLYLFCSSLTIQLTVGFKAMHSQFPSTWLFTPVCRSSDEQGISRVMKLHSSALRRGYLRLATGGWRAAARCRPVSTHARHTADLATTAQVQWGGDTDNTQKPARVEIIRFNSSFEQKPYIHP